MTAQDSSIARNFLELQDSSDYYQKIETSHDDRISNVISHGHNSEAALEPVAVHKTKAINLWEIVIFAIICTADMISTVYWYTHGQALESNPILAYWLNKSVAAFCIAKIATFGPLLIACAILREKYARVITPGLRIAMAAYVVIYIASVVAQIV